METLSLQNPWWKEKTVPRELIPQFKRNAFGEVEKLLPQRQMLILSGLRRVGKSTLMYQLVEKLLQGDTPPQNILFFSFDEKIESLLDVLKEYSELTGVDWEKEPCFLFFDEIQKLNDWSNKMKLIYDRFPLLKFIVSGSSSFKLEKEARANLTGRHFLVEVAPLSFKEYLSLKNSPINLKQLKLWEKEIKKEFEDYLLRPFPEIVSFEDKGLIKRYIKDQILEKIIKMDLSRFKGLRENLLVNLIDIFYSRPGTYLNFDALAKNLKVRKIALRQHLYYLEFAYLVRVIKNFRPSARSTSRKLARVYPFHFALQFGWNGQINSEAVVASFFEAQYYWREETKEIDFLVGERKILPIEVKESSQVHLGELLSLRYFLRKFNLKEGMLIYGGEEEKIGVDGLVINKLPFWKLFLQEKEKIVPQTDD